MSRNCKNFDAFLSDDLPAEEATGFAEHLRHCDECREAVDEQRWIDGLLHSNATTAIETPPAKILATLRTSISRRSRRAKFIACGLAAAATIFVAMAWTALRHPTHDQSHDGAPSGRLANDNSYTDSSQRATFIAGSNVIAIPIASGHPDVTVVRVYPTYVPPYETQTAAIQPEAVTYDNFTSYPSGG
jgi:anti-sigma factor RsiW